MSVSGLTSVEASRDDKDLQGEERRVRGMRDPVTERACGLFNEAKKEGDVPGGGLGTPYRYSMVAPLQR